MELAVLVANLLLHRAQGTEVLHGRRHHVSVQLKGDAFRSARANLHVKKNRGVRHGQRGPASGARYRDRKGQDRPLKGNRTCKLKDSRSTGTYRVKDRVASPPNLLIGRRKAVQRVASMARSRAQSWDSMEGGTRTVAVDLERDYYFY